MPLQLVSTPAGEPVSLSEAKAHLRVEGDEENALIGSLISAARQAVETLTARQLLTARWRLVLDAFPGASPWVSELGASFSLPGHAVLLTKCPVQSVVSVQYLEMNGTWATMAATDWVLDTSCEPARLTPVFGRTWPCTLPQIGAVTVTFDAGYGATGAAVPEPIKQAIKLLVGTYYVNREHAVMMPGVSLVSLPMGFEALLQPYRVYGFG